MEVSFHIVRANVPHGDMSNKTPDPGDPANVLFVVKDLASGEEGQESEEPPVEQ